MSSVRLWHNTPLAWRLGFLYAALFVVVGFYLPYMPVWLHWRDNPKRAVPAWLPPRHSLQ